MELRYFLACVRLHRIYEKEQAKTVTPKHFFLTPCPNISGHYENVGKVPYEKLMKRNI